MKGMVMKVVVTVLVLLGLWATVGHYLVPRPSAEVLQQMSYPPGPEWFLEQMPRYDRHALLGALHVVPSFLFMLLVLFQLNQRLRQRRPHLHRVMGRVLVSLGVVVGVSGVVIGVVMPFGGGLETLATLLIGLGFLGSLGMGVWRVRQGRIEAHRYWMLHMVGMGLVPVTMRILLSISMYSTTFTGPELFGPTLLLGLLVNLLVLHGLVLTPNARAEVPLSNATEERGLRS